MGGGGIQSSQNQESSIAQQQAAVAQQSNAQSEAQYQQSQLLQAPLIAQQQKLAAGSPSDVLAASMPAISQISAGYTGARDSIFNTIAPGAARDQALTNLETQKATTIAGGEAQAVQQAPSILANLGAGAGAFSVQELGAALSGYSGSANTTGQVLQSQTAQQAAKLGVAGSLLGAAGEVGGGFASKGSDRRLKTDIAELSDVLAKLDGIQPVTFKYRSTGESHIGVIAQEIEPDFPQATGTRADGMMYVDYGQLAAVAIQAAKELHGMVLNLSARLERFEHAKAQEEETFRRMMEDAGATQSTYRAVADGRQ